MVQFALRINVETLVTTPTTEVDDMIPFPTVQGTWSMLAGEDNLDGAGSSGSQAWPGANRAFYCLIDVWEDITIQGFFCLNTVTVAAGNLDLGIYNSSLSKVVSTGTTAKTAGDVLQFIAVAPTALTAGAYWLAMAVDNNTDTFRRCTVPVNVGGNHRVKQENVYPLPATATPVVNASQFFYYYGLSRVALL